jgi:hypothetical protein
LLGRGSSNPPSSHGFLDSSQHASPSTSFNQQPDELSISAEPIIPTNSIANYSTSDIIDNYLSNTIDQADWVNWVGNDIGAHSNELLRDFTVVNNGVLSIYQDVFITTISSLSLPLE